MAQPHTQRKRKRFRFLCGTGRIARGGLGHDEYRIPRHFVWRQRNRSRVLGARQLGGFTSFLALGFTSFLAPAFSRETNKCV